MDKKDSQTELNIQKYPEIRVSGSNSDGVATIRTQLQSEHATLSFLVCSIYNKLFKRLLKVEHSLGSGYFMVDYEYKPITEKEASLIENELLLLLDSNTEISFKLIDRESLYKYFTEHNFHDKLGLLKTWTDDLIKCIEFGEYIDFVIEPMSINKERLKIFEIRAYENGIILRFPILIDQNRIPPWNPPDMLFDMFREYREWAKLVDCDTVAKLNDIIYFKKLDDLKWLCEGLHYHKFYKIGESLVNNFDNKRIVTIAGPSSSNKTTFALRLSIELKVFGFDSTVISMDDYYRDNKDIPFDPVTKIQDFEAISALNVELLGERVRSLLTGNSIPVRHFNFKTGCGTDSDTERIKLKEKQFLIIEGIHGLNPTLLQSIGQDCVTPIYVSALTPLRIDFNHRFPTSDLRLIRRIIRDYNTRGYSPRQTIRRWTSVRVGEEKNIFPFQSNAEHFFNSSLVYELPVLCVQGKGLLAQATTPDPGEDPESIESKEVTAEARRVLNLLNFFYPISTEVVPHISCIREFVGGSDLKY